MIATNETWTYIIVGGGSAGCVLANRLSENPAHRVLLLEAGGEDSSIFAHIPAGFIRIPPSYNWRYEADPDPSRNGLVDHWAAGKVLGGGSTINGMMWVRGNAADYDEWAALGATGWAFKDVLPYFKRAESFDGGASDVRGGEGPVHVTRCTARHPMSLAFLAACAQTQIPTNPDFNGERQEGAGLTQSSTRRGWRQSTAKAYLKSARRRGNLSVLTGAFATRVVFDGKCAVGVEYQHGGALKTASCGGEIILSGGTFQSPKLLMLSGVGRAEHLQGHGLAVVADRPAVGQNLQEEPYASLVFHTTVPTLNTDRSPLRGLAHLLNFVLRGQGVIGEPPTHVMAFLRLNPASRLPDSQITFLAGAITNAPKEGASKELGQHDVNTFRFYERPAVTVLPAVLHPRGRGSISLRSSRPEDGPRLSHNVLGDPDDLRRLTEVCRVVRRILEAPAIAPLVLDEMFPGPGVQSDAEWEAALRMSTWRGEHGVGTCRMGSDPDSVVDPELRVRGVTGLRVIDASIMPTLTSGNTNAPTIMIAEKGAAHILARGR